MKKEHKHIWKKFSESFYRIFTTRDKNNEMPTHYCSKCGIMAIIKEDTKQGELKNVK